MITRVLHAIHRWPNDSENNDVNVKVHVSGNGNLYVKEHELAQSAPSGRRQRN